MHVHVHMYMWKKYIIEIVEGENIQDIFIDTLSFFSRKKSLDRKLISCGDLFFFSSFERHAEYLAKVLNVIIIWLVLISVTIQY